MFSISNLFSLVNLISLFYLYQSVRLLNRIRRQWATLRKNPLSRQQKQVAEEASFFVSVPPSVVVHELGHAVAVWAFGGRVIDFGYGFFWGFVLPAGTFTAAEDWFISLAGTLGSLLFGGAVWLLLRRHPTDSMRYFGLRTLWFQIIYSLIGYPLLSAILPIGDWRSIYDFGQTPILSSGTAVLHLAALGWLWYATRQGWFEAPAFDNAAAKERYTAVQQQATMDTDVQSQLMLVSLLRQGGAPNLAKQTLDRLIAIHPQNGSAYFERALLSLGRGQSISESAARDLENALNLGLSNRQQMTIAHQFLGRYYLDRNRGEDTIHHLSQAIATAVTSLDHSTMNTAEKNRAAFLYSERSQAYRRRKQYDLAYQDIQQAIKLAEAAQNKTAVKQFHQELDILQNHAGRPF